MFDFCLAPDTSGDGTGCDNMTCVIVCFDGLSTSVVERTAASGAIKRKASEIDTDNVTTSNDDADDVNSHDVKRLKSSDDETDKQVVTTTSE